MPPDKMLLQCDLELAGPYKSQSQKARILTEAWCIRELYCVACDSNRLAQAPANTQAIDFRCPTCEEPYQLKSGKGWNQERIVDAGYQAMITAIRKDRTPNLLLMQYSSSWAVCNLTVIPRFFFSEAAIEKRTPLSPQARRAGWVGCNIRLSRVPPDGRISIVAEGDAFPPAWVRQQFKRALPLSALRPQLRGWTLDVLTFIRSLNKGEFSLSDIYASEAKLRTMHPLNQNIKPKIRQQLQVLRDLGFLRFIEPGRYALVEFE